MPYFLPKNTSNLPKNVKHAHSVSKIYPLAFYKRGYGTRLHFPASLLLRMQMGQSFERDQLTKVLNYVTESVLETLFDLPKAPFYCANNCE